MSRPGVFFVEFATPLRAFPGLVLAAFLPARARAQALASPNKSEHGKGLGARTAYFRS
jgi:hypothetical protein